MVYSLTARNKKILCDNHTHERLTQVISVGLLEFATDYSYPASVGMSRDKFLALLTMFPLNNNDAKAARGQPGYDPLFKIRPVIDSYLLTYSKEQSPS